LIGEKTYEVLLRFEDGHEELRLGDHLNLLSRGKDTLALRGELWHIVAEVDAASPDRVGRLICERQRGPATRAQRRRSFA
jgi:hypothetical protein